MTLLSLGGTWVHSAAEGHVIPRAHGPLLVQTKGCVAPRHLEVGQPSSDIKQNEVLTAFVCVEVRITSKLESLTSMLPSCVLRKEPK